MALTNKEIAERVIELVGGPSNILEATSCMTRLHVRLVDQDKVDEVGLKNLEGAMGIVPGEVYQIVFGPGKVTRVRDEFLSLLKDMPQATADEIDLKSRASVEKEARKKKHDGPIQRFFKRFANIFLPLLPGIAAAGMINGITKVINFNTDNAYVDVWWYALIMTIGWALFAYLAILAAENAAEEFGGTRVLGAIGGALSVTNASMPLLKKIGEEGTAILLPITDAAFNPAAGGLLAAVFTGMLMATVEKKVRPFIPEVVDMFLTPLITLLIVGFVSLLILQPFGAFLTTGLLGTAEFLFTKLGALGGFILATVQLPLVSVGLHRVFTPIHAIMNDPSGPTGGVNQLLPILMVAGGGQVGAVLALYAKTDNKRLKQAILAAAPAGVLGVGEPLMYGVTLPLMKPFITACIGSGVGGAVISIFKVGAISQGVSGIMGFLIMEPGKHLGYLIGMLAAYAAGFVITYFFGYDEEAVNDLFE